MEISEKKIKTYQVDGLNSEVDAISIVEYPAIEQNFVYLNRDKAMFSVNQEKRMLYGPVLIPDFPIYRNNGYEEYNIVFSANAIEQLSKRFMTEARNNQWTTEHSMETDALSVVETWIKSGGSDKSVLLGFDLPDGTWFAGVSVNDNTLWEQIKAGQFKGFSVESFLDLREMENNFNKQSNMDKEEKMNKFMDAFKAFLSEFLEKDEPEAEPTEVKEEEKVEEEQNDATDEPTETVEEQPETAEPEEAETVEENLEAVEEAIEQLEEKTSELENEELKSQIEELQKQNQELMQKVEQLSKQPSAEPVNVNARPADSREFLRNIANKI